MIQELLSPAQIINQNITLLDYLNAQNLTSIKEAQLPQQISCPLHRDRKPSFRLYRPAQNGGYCFSCGKAYTAFSMHQALNQLSYKETILYFTTAPEFQYLNLEQAIKEATQNPNTNIQQPKYLRTKELSGSVNIVFGKLKKIKEAKELATNFRELEKRIYKAYMTGTIFKLKES